MNGTADAGAKLRLYELVIDNGRPISPYVWRVCYALAHKGLPFESVPVGFSDIAHACGGRFKTVPIIEHGDTALAESWDIIDYLERTFPDRPALFSGPAEYAMVRLVDAWLTGDLQRKLFGLYALDIHDALRPEDRPYFRASREARVGTTLEAFTAERAARVPAVREALAPLRVQLARAAFLGGAQPNYADYIAFSAFQWAASVATLPLLSRTDQRLIGWIERGFDLFGGLGRDDRMRPLVEPA
ncbi:MAG TPA: glutathione S-transferase N-terminal domain-containing protein [Steroidobacteraceae bacterium]|nr:glutathione S-transferase N-terminal domain-containing protein [Steroidobacteraceae bacterium]